jgi:hypothetical protein
MKYNTSKALEELETLFDDVPPETLREQLNFIFFQYLVTTEVKDLHPEFRNLSENFYSLIKFLSQLEKPDTESFINK